MMNSAELNISPSGAKRSPTRLVLMGVFLLVVAAGLIGIAKGSNNPFGAVSSNPSLRNQVVATGADSGGQLVVNANTATFSQVQGLVQAHGCPGIRRSEGGWNEDTMEAISCELTPTKITMRARGIHRAWYIIQEVEVTASATTLKKGEITNANTFKETPTVRAGVFVHLIFTQYTRTDAPPSFSTVWDQILAPHTLPKQVGVRKSGADDTMTIFPKVYAEGHASHAVIDAWALAMDGSLTNVENMYNPSPGLVVCTLDTSSPNGQYALQVHSVGATLPLAGSPPCSITSFVHFT